MIPIDPLKVAVIGGGVNSAVGNAHRIALQMDNCWKPVAGCFSRNPVVNDESARCWGVCSNRRYSEWKSLLAGETGHVDAILILAPTPLHGEMVLNCLKAGYAVICEKALASSINESEQILQYVTKNKSFVAVTYNYSGYPMIRELRERIHQGELGRIQHIHIEMPQEGFLRRGQSGEKSQPQAWRLQDGEIPTVSLDLGVHLHQMVNFLSGQVPVEVVSDHCTYGYFPEVVDTVFALVRYTDGLRVQMWYGKAALGIRNGLRIRVFGTEGSGEWLQTQPEELTICRRDGSRLLIDRATTGLVASEKRYHRFKAGHPAGFIEAFANHYHDVAEDLRRYQKGIDGSSPYVLHCDIAHEGLRLLSTIADAARKQCFKKIL